MPKFRHKGKYQNLYGTEPDQVNDEIDLEMKWSSKMRSRSIECFAFDILLITADCAQPRNKAIVHNHEIKQARSMLKGGPEINPEQASQSHSA